ncbi:MAG: ABC transporter substrate-binding protein [Planctomycetes bacterium]|nr:ABC transporter substrate-binding protein [Planctomycetota bacterium]
MSRRRLLPAALAAAITVATAAICPAQPPPAAPAAPTRLGVFFWHDSPNDVATFAGVRLGLERAGLRCEFVERRADSDAQRAKVCLRELRDAGCRALLVLGTQAALLAKAEVTDLPVVFAAVTNPVASGITTDWGPSGSNLCGASNWIAADAVLSVFRLAVPGLTRLGVLRTRSSGVVSAAELAAMRELLARPAAPALQLEEVVTDDEKGLPAAVRQLLAAKVDAIWIPIDITVYQHLPTIEAALAKTPVPLLTTAAAGVRQGALVGANVDYRLHGQRAAALLLDVLQHGRAPGALPVDRMRSTIVAVNLAAARRLQVQLPLSLLAIADDLVTTTEPSDAR